MTSRPPSKPWRVHGPRGMSTDYHSQRAASEAAGRIAQGGTQATVYHWLTKTDANGLVTGFWRLHKRVDPVTTDPDTEG